MPSVCYYAVRSVAFKFSWDLENARQFCDGKIVGGKNKRVYVWVKWMNNEIYTHDRCNNESH